MIVVKRQIGIFPQLNQEKSHFEEMIIMSALYSGPPREILQGGTVVLPSYGPSHERPPPLSGRISLSLTRFNAKLPPETG